MVHSALLMCAMGLLTVVKSSQMVHISAQLGENVTIWCKHNSDVGKHIHWFKQTNGAVPLSIVQMMMSYKLIEKYIKRSNSFQPGHFEMLLNDKNTSLSILNVDISDSGLYFCGWLKREILFGDGAYLDIKVKSDTPVKYETVSNTVTKGNTDLKSPISAKDCFGNIFYRLTFIFGAAIVILAIIPLSLIIIKIRKTHKKDEDRHSAHHEDSHSSVYAALRFSKQKTRRADRHNEDTHVVYSATR